MNEISYICMEYNIYICMLLYYCQCLIDYEISSPNENFLYNERFWAVAETDTGSRK